MQIQSSIGSVVGNNSSVHWAQTIKTPHIYGIIEASDAASIAQTIGMQAINKITQHASKPIVSLHELEHIANEGMHEGIKSIALVVSVGTVLYVVVRGKGCVYLKRNGQYARLLDHEGSISGEAKESDVVLLVSDACQNTVTEGEMMGIFDHMSVNEVSAKFAVLLSGKEDSAGCAALLLEIVKFIPSERPELQEERVVAVGMPNIIGRIKSSSSSLKVSRFIRSNPHEKMTTVKRHVAFWLRRMKNPKVSVTMLLCVLFGVSILFGIHKEFSMKSDAQLTSIMKEATRVYEEGTALLELNPVKGRERLVEAKTLLTPLKEIVTTKTKDGRRVLELYSQIENALTQAMHAYEVEPTLFYDAGLLKSGGVIQKMAIAEDSLVLADIKERAIYSLSLPGKTGQIVAGGTGYDMTQEVAIHGDTGYALLSDGIQAISLESKKTTPNIIKKSDEWGRITALVSFGGNLYLLDTEKGRIWKYVAVESGFSDIREYLNPDTLPDLSKATSMAIDGSLWIGTTNGKILRFTQGKENTFIAKGVDPTLGTDLVVYTSDSVNNVYVLDKENKRVVVLDKDGVYLSQYVWKGQYIPSSLVVSEKHGKILLLASGALYSIDLK